MDTFNFLVRNLKINNYKELIDVRREEIEKAADLKKHGIFLKKEEWNLKPPKDWRFYARQSKVFIEL